MLITKMPYTTYSYYRKYYITSGLLAIFSFAGAISTTILSSLFFKIKSIFLVLTIFFLVYSIYSLINLYINYNKISYLQKLLYDNNEQIISFVYDEYTLQDIALRAESYSELNTDYKLTIGSAVIFVTGIILTTFFSGTIGFLVFINAIMVSLFIYLIPKLFKSQDYRRIINSGGCVILGKHGALINGSIYIFNDKNNIITFPTFNPYKGFLTIRFIKGNRFSSHLVNIKIKIPEKNLKDGLLAYDYYSLESRQ